MSNDKTLAHVQPGGLVGLGDQAERARFEQYRGGDFELDAQGYYTNPRTAQDWAMWQAALADRQPVEATEQPYNSGGIELTACQLHEALLLAGSPELHVPFEDRSLVRIFWTETGHSGRGLYCECVGAEEEGCILLDGTAPAIGRPAQAVDLPYSLAARQPAGEPVAVVVPGAPTRCGLCESTHLEWFASVRAVNDVPHGRLTTHDVSCVFVLGCNECSETLHVAKADAIAPLLAAPPAQAVGLDAARALLQRRIEQWRSHLPADPDAPGTREIETKSEHDYSNDVRIYREGIAVMEEVLAMTDSQAVGNG